MHRAPLSRLATRVPRNSVANTADSSGSHPSETCVPCASPAQGLPSRWPSRSRVVTGRGQAGAFATGVSGPVACLRRGCFRNTSRRTSGIALGRLRLRQHELQSPPLVLRASRRTPEEYQNQSISQVVADACKSEARFAGMEITKSLQPADGLRLPVRKAQGQQTTRLGFGVEEEDPTGVQENRHQGCGLAYIPAHGGNHARRDGRTPAHDPGLLAPRESACDQQVSSGNDNEQTAGTGEVGGCESASRRAV